MSKASLLVWAVVAEVLGIGWVVTWHLIGLAALVVIGLPVFLGMLSLKYGQ